MEKFTLAQRTQFVRTNTRPADVRSNRFVHVFLHFELCLLATESCVCACVCVFGVVSHQHLNEWHTRIQMIMICFVMPDACYYCNAKSTICASNNAIEPIYIVPHFTILYNSMYRTIILLRIINDCCEVKCSEWIEAKVGSVDLFAHIYADSITNYWMKSWMVRWWWVNSVRPTESSNTFHSNIFVSIEMCH